MAVRVRVRARLQLAQAKQFQQMLSTDPDMAMKMVHYQRSLSQPHLQGLPNSGAVAAGGDQPAEPSGGPPGAGVGVLDPAMMAVLAATSDGSSGMSAVSAMGGGGTPAPAPAQMPSSAPPPQQQQPQQMAPVSIKSESAPALSTAVAAARVPEAATQQQFNHLLTRTCLFLVLLSSKSAVY